MAFEYYYGTQADQFNFIRVPKLLMHDVAFTELSVDAKMLYGLLLDRMNLSMKNGWFDDENRVYIIYQITEIMDDMNMARGTAVKYLNELEKFGLVEKKKRGLGLPNIIYVKSFLTQRDCRNLEGETEPKKDENMAETPINTQKSKNCTSRSSNIRLQEVQNLDFKDSKNCTSGSSEIRFQEVQDLDPNNTNKSNTNINNNNINNTNSNNTKKNNTEFVNISSYPLLGSDNLDVTGPKDCTNVVQEFGNLVKGIAEQKRPDKMRKDDGLSEFNDYMKYIKEVIDYDALIDRRPLEKSEIDGIVNLIVETIISDNDYIVISSNKFPKEVVKSRFSKLTMSHIEYVLECMNQNTTDIKNIKKYLLAALYNAPTTIDSYYRARVNHDMPQFAARRDSYGYN